MSRLLIKSSLCLIIICIVSIQSVGAINEPHFKAEPLNWDEGMMRAKITTEQLGLAFRVSIINPYQADIDIDKIRISMQVRQGGELVSQKNGIVYLENIHLPEGAEVPVYLKVEFPHDIIGDYEVQLTYEIDNWVPEKIEPYPFEFRVVGNELFEEEIKRSSPLIDLPDIHIDNFISLGGFTMLGVGALLTELYRRFSGNS